MRVMNMLATMMLGGVSAAFAASGVQSQEPGLLIYFFIGFFALIVVSQLVPAAILFIGMVRGVMARPEKVSVDKN